MKFPKNRANVFVVVREDTDEFRLQLLNTAILGVFGSLEEADNYKGACEQEWKEKMGDWTVDPPIFEIRMTTFYV